MRRFLKRLRKGIKGACLTAVLATCWQVGQVAQAGLVQQFNPGDKVTLRFSGTVSPTENDVSHLFLIYGTGYSSQPSTFYAVKLGDFSVGQTGTFSVFENATYPHIDSAGNGGSVWWLMAGLYGDISSGYDEGVNGVTLVLSNITEGDSWGSHASSLLDEEVMFNYLLNDDYEQLSLANKRLSSEYREWLCLLEFNTNGNLFDFSTASANGEMYIESEVVPEPITIVLLGTGGLVILRRRGES